ncbi:MAG TPA: Mrp/NBP35 family ATP-binding protein [Candidatus Krumholzibacteria bacterium]|nr:Mrp/NBP35 family ATP-binding protein [Candidatus Krumholzibacteria bacterium]HPD72106.1 Mrp/NBP35 family ATP-binding protein [Candidatus Krumholzibacteria bacterium]HRY40962.1 Mrp/NBP35 family ATP-binding protein [Candidatus Krumholzibacteria bacterium]
MSLTRDDILAALREVKVPGTKVDIVKIDLVGKVQVDGGEVLVEIVRTSEKEETIEAVRAAALDRLRALPGIRSLSVEVDDRSGGEGKRKAAPAGPHGQSPDPWADRGKLPGVRRVVAVASAKGGVGKSSVAVNLALALAEHGHRVGLLDADIYGPSLPTMLRVDTPPEVTEERRIIPGRAAGLQVLSMGLLIDPNQAVIWRGPMVFSAVKQFLKDTAWEDLDYLVVDMPPGTGDAQLTLVQQVPLAGVVMVTTPQEMALADVRRGVQMFRQVDVPVLGIVENMSYFLCPDNGKRYDIFGTGGGQRVADQFGLPLLAQIPIEPQIREGGDTGRPVMLPHQDSPARRTFLDLAGRVHALADRVVV